jgi:acylphosphatase
MRRRRKKKRCTRWQPPHHSNSSSLASGTLRRINAGSVTANPASICVRFTVHGKVQGVFFRASSREVAQRLGLTGHAINRPDGSVEVLVCGAADAVESMRIWLQKGPRTARVDSLHEEPVNGVTPVTFRTS